MTWLLSQKFWLEYGTGKYLKDLLFHLIYILTKKMKTITFLTKQVSWLYYSKNISTPQKKIFSSDFIKNLCIFIHFSNISCHYTIALRSFSCHCLKWFLNRIIELQLINKDMDKYGQLCSENNISQKHNTLLLSCFWLLITEKKQRHALHKYLP